MQWVKATKDDLKNIDSKQWRDSKGKNLSPSLAYHMIKLFHRDIEVLDERTPYPLLKSVNDLLGLTGCASLEEVGLKFERMRKKVEETSPVKVSEPPY